MSSGCGCGLLSDSLPLGEKSKIDFGPTKVFPNSTQKLWSWSEAPRFRILLSAMAAASSLMITPISCGFGRQQILSRNQLNSAVRQRRILSPGRQQASAILGSKFLCDLEQRRRLLRQGAGSRGREVLRFQRKTGQARAGLPVVSGIPVLGPVLNAFLNPVVLFIIYAAGGSRRLNTEISFECGNTAVCKDSEQNVPQRTLISHVQDTSNRNSFSSLFMTAMVAASLELPLMWVLEKYFRDTTGKGIDLPLAPAQKPISQLILASRFWSGFGRTTYTNSASTKFALTALWPALFFASAAYRSNFKKAIR